MLFKDDEAGEEQLVDLMELGEHFFVFLLELLQLTQETALALAEAFGNGPFAGVSVAVCVFLEIVGDFFGVDVDVLNDVDVVLLNVVFALAFFEFVFALGFEEFQFAVALADGFGLCFSRFLFSWQQLLLLRRLLREKLLVQAVELALFALLAGGPVLFRPSLLFDRGLD